MFRVLGDRVVLRPITDAQSRGGIIIPIRSQSASRGEVVLVGHERTDDGVIPLTVTVGDVVIFEKGAGQEVLMDGEKVLVLREIDIFGIIVD